MIEVREVSRSFAGSQVLREVSFTVPRGRMTGFVGRNGSGKTTTMRIILGVLAAHHGEVLFDGRAIAATDRARFGYMPEERGLYPKMKVAEQLVYLARLHGLGRVDAQRETEQQLEQFGLEQHRNDPLERLSLGNQQRVQIAAALVHRPVALVLDEPFSGLDPVAIEVVLGVLRNCASEGTPVLFSSHQLDLVERLCDEVVLIDSGRILARGSKEALIAQHAGREFELEFGHELPTADWLLDQPGVSDVRVKATVLRFAAQTDEAAQAVLARAVAAHQSGDTPMVDGEACAGVPPVVRFGKLSPSLTQIFREVVQ